MATCFLLESKIKWNPLLPTTSPNRRFPTIFSIKLCTQTPRIPKPSASKLRLKIMVGLLGTARSLQHDLNRIAVTADTSNSKGFSNVLTKTVVALRRHPDFCISGYSSVDVKQNMNEGEKLFKRLSTEERRKFDEETLVNLNNIRKQTSSSQRANGTSNEYIVITILVAAKGVHKLPTINGSGDLKKALQKLGSIPANETLAVQVLWTPQIENDTLTERELLEDYPLLHPLQENSTFP